MKKIFTILALTMLTIIAPAQNSRTDKMLDRFVRYARVNSQDAKNSENEFPVTEGQKQMATLLYNEIKAIPGVEASISPDWYVYAKIPSNAPKNCPSILFMAHSDITNEAPGGNIQPQVHRGYKGGDIVLKNGIVISPDKPEGTHLNDCINKTIVTSDGTTLLGADDKTGCAEIVTAIKEIAHDKKSKHGDIYFCITQNEDLGMAADRFDIAYLGGKSPDIVIDIDGGNYGEYSRSNFTGLQAIYTFHGKPAHPSYAYGTDYTDALSAASIFIAALPIEAHPLNSKGKEGYLQAYIFKVQDNGDIEVTVRVRYFTKQDSVRFAKYLDNAKAKARAVWPKIEINENQSLAYDNIAFSMHPATTAILEKSAAKLGVPTQPIDLRAGTTASMMVVKGLRGGPCIYSGQNSEHSVYEWCCIEDMLQTVDLVKEIVTQTANLK